MKKFKKMTISLLLIFAITVSFCSCEYIDMAKSLIDKMGGKVVDTPDTTDDITDDTLPPDNNPGDDIIGLKPEEILQVSYELYWLDTYEEVLAAIELLESHGSTVNDSIAFNYESDTLDSKYLFLCRKGNAAPLEDGKSFFDRKMDEGFFLWYGFYSDITVEDLTNDLRHFLIAENVLCIGGAQGYSELELQPGNIDGDIIDTIVDTSRISIVVDHYGFADTVDTNSRLIGLAYDENIFLSLIFSIYEVSPFLPIEYQREFLETFVVIE